MAIKQLQEGERFDLLGVKLITVKSAPKTHRCDGCYLHRQIGTSMDCMYPYLACHPEDNALGLDLIIKKEDEGI